MRVFKISCYSTCGSYFASYLKSITVIASCKTEAIDLVEKWMDDNDLNFIYDKNKWAINDLASTESGVIDYDMSSDY